MAKSLLKTSLMFLMVTVDLGLVQHVRDNAHCYVGVSALTQRILFCAGMLYERHAKELDEGVGDDSHYRTDSEEALDLHNSSMLYSTGSEYVRRAAIDLVLMDPVFGPLICAYNTEDTEVPSIDEALTLPSVGSPLFTASELGDEEEIEDDDNIYYTSGEDEADMPGSPTDLQVYEESESHDTLGVKVSFCSFSLFLLHYLGLQPLFSLLLYPYAYPLNVVLPYTLLFMDVIKFIPNFMTFGSIVIGEILPIS